MQNGHLVIGSIYFSALDNNNNLVRGRIRLCHGHGPHVENNNLNSWYLLHYNPQTNIITDNNPIDMRNVNPTNAIGYNFEYFDDNPNLIIGNHINLVPLHLKHASRGGFTTQYNNEFTQQIIFRLVDAIRNGADNLAVAGIMRNHTSEWGWQWYTNQEDGL